MASRAPAHADVERVGGVGEVPCLLHVGFGLFFSLFAFVFGQPLVKPCLEPVGERLFRPDGLRGFLRGLWRRFTIVFTFARETPPVIDARPVEARKAEDAGHWTSVAGYGEVFTTTELFDVTAARDHFDGTVEAGECRFCAFDARNREHHAQNAGKLF